MKLKTAAALSAGLYLLAACGAGIENAPQPEGQHRPGQKGDSHERKPESRP